jgi:uncharacterized protein (TIGR00369 family)
MTPEHDTDLIRQRFEAAVDGHEPEFERFFLFRFLGLSATYGPGTCRIDVPAEPLLYNPHGTLHGGIIALVIDVSMGHLLRNEGYPGVTVDLHTNFLRAVRGPAAATATISKAGRRIVHVASDVTDDQGRSCATATATYVRPDPSTTSSDA